MKNILKEFKEFINRGNVVDMAVGVVVGSAFAKIVAALVDYIIMPIVGCVIGGYNFSSLAINFRGASIQYGAFIEAIVDFVIVAACIFFFVKFINKLQNLKKKPKEETAEVAPKSDEVLLLEEIRDLLKKQK